MIRKLTGDALLMLGYMSFVLSPTFFVDKDYITSLLLISFSISSFIISYKLIKHE